MTIAERGRAAREIAHAMVAVIVIAAVTIVPMRAMAVTEPVVGDRGSITANSALWGAAIEDVTGDARDDLLVTEHRANTNVLAVYRQLAGGALVQTPAIHALDAAPIGNVWQDWLDTSTGDLDGDGDQDVVVGRFEGLEIFHRAGSTFDAPVTIQAQGIVEEVVAEDLNGDGLDDVVYADRSSDDGHRIMRRFQTSPGTFGSAVLIAASSSGRFTVGDVDSDARPDILVDDPWATELTVLLHDDPGQGFTATTYGLNGVRSSAVGDVTGDGRHDVLALQEGTLTLLAGLSGGGLGGPTVVQTDIYQASSVDIGDMNADGRLDAVVFSAANLDVLLQSDAGTLLPRCPMPSLTPTAYAGLWSETALGDLNGDGRTDAAATQLDETVRMATQIAPGNPVPTSIAILPLGTAQINDPIELRAILDATVPGCLAEPELELWRRLPGGAAQLMDSFTLAPYGNATWQIRPTDDPGVLGTVEYQAVWPGDGWRDGSQSPWEPLEVVKRPTSLTIQSSDSQLLVGETTTLTADLIGGEPGSEIRLSAVADGVSTPIGTEAVDGSGQAAFEVGPVTTTTYRADYAGDPVWAAATSPQVEVQVDKHPTSLRLRLSRRLIPFGATAELTATLAGGAEDRAVRFFSVVDGHTQLIDEVAPDGAGVASVQVAPKVSTRYMARFVGDDTWAPASSPKEEIQVHVLTSGTMTRFLRKKSGVALYRCCTATYAFRVKPNYAGEPARIRLGVKGPGGGWQGIDEARFRLRPNSTVVVRVRIAGGSGHQFRLSGCLRDQPKHRGWCSTPSRFAFVGGRTARPSTNTAAFIRPTSVPWGGAHT